KKKSREGRGVSFYFDTTGTVCKSNVSSTIKLHAKIAYCKRLNFREDLISANFANRLRFARHRSREQFRQYVNTTEVTFD
ncbi:MAG: hypothetical protein PV344_03480, partial [Anaplasma sp.]|nr:hypothetical protein [Anaplasma sp.]